ncbi:MAG: CPBP family intramembrane metalloprotease [Treponema sp.]|nr:CPBP family intramembrane metalloprotease [Treponema sp.]
MKRPIQFIILTCLVSWAVAGTAIYFGIRDTTKISYVIFGACYMLLPAICSVILQLIHKEKLFSNLNISFRLNWWFLVAGIVPVVLSFTAMGISLFFPNVLFSSNYGGILQYIPEEQMELAVEQLSRFPPIVFVLLQVVQAIVAGYTINAVFAFGEELGWRGYLLKALQGKKFLLVSLITGAVWGVWHFPLILIGHNYPQHPIAGVAMMVIFCILLSPMMTYIVIKSKSVITAAIFHGSINAIAGISLIFLVGGNDLTNGMTGAAGFITLLLGDIAFYLYDRFITKDNIFTKAIGDC